MSDAVKLRGPGYAGSVLVVEDDEMVASAWRQSLTRSHFAVHIARNVPEALDALDLHATDVVVSDLLMPGGTGLDLLKLLEERDASLPVIIVTADQSVEAAAAAVREHAFDYLTKPVRSSRLIETVRRAIDARRSDQIRRQEEERLREEHRQLAIRHQRTAMLLSVLYDRAVEGIVVVDADGRLVDASESFVALAGQPLHELLDAEIGELFDRHPTEGDIGERVRALAAEASEQDHWRGAVTVRGARGRRLPARMSLSVCETPQFEGAVEGARYVIALLSHESGYEDLSRHLQQADRLANIGLLAGSAAHEIKNELGPLLGYLTMIERAEDQPVDPQMLTIMRQSVRRVHEHVEQILEPLRPRVRTRGAVVLRETVDQILAMLRKAGMIRRIQLEVEAGDEEVVVHGDKNEIHQIALNLITNAVDALEEGRGARGHIWISLRYEGSFGVLEVRDDGRGISEELRAQVFEPFFTTKEAGGTGLGLPVVQDIVRALGGRVSLEAAESRGTVATAWIPRYEAGR